MNVTVEQLLQRIGAKDVELMLRELELNDARAQVRNLEAAVADLQKVTKVEPAKTAP